MKKSLFCLIVAAATISAASANVLDLSYSVNPGNGGLYDYSFTLSVDPTTTLNSGDSWSWIIFGDSVSSTSPINDFALTSAPPGPFNYGLTGTSGLHNGPTFIYNSQDQIAYWVPVNHADTLTWTGTSATELTQGNLLYSELISTNGQATDSFAVATQSVPAPSGILALTFGLAGLAFLKSRAR